MWPAATVRRLLLALLLSAGVAQAQFSLSGEVGLTTTVGASVAGGFAPVGVSTAYRAHLEAEIDLDPITLRGVFDPSFTVPGPAPTEPTADPGLTEAYVRYREGDLDLSAGLERLPLSGARLSEPFGLEPRGAGGQPQGVLGVRASYFGSGWRARPVLIYQDRRFGGSLSVRGEFGSFELEGHAVYLGTLAGGLTASGLVGDLVLYGEGWLLTDPLRGRGALGLSGFWGDALWTLEAALAPAPTTGSGFEAPAFPQFGGQLNLPVGDEGSLDLLVGVGLPESPLMPGETLLVALADVRYSLLRFDHQVTIGPTVSYSGLGTTIGVSMQVTAFF